MLKSVPQISNKCKRLLSLIIMAWGTILTYEALRQSVEIRNSQVAVEVQQVDWKNLDSRSIQGGTKESIQRRLKQEPETADYHDGVANVLLPENNEYLDKLGDFERAFDYVKHKSHNCTEVTRPQTVPPLLYDKWYTFHSEIHEIYVYSVYYDERIDNGLFPDIRMLAVAKAINTTTYCQVWYPNIDHPYVTELKVKKNGRGHKLGDTHYMQYYFSCQLETNYPIPNFVSITETPCVQSTNYIPIFVPIRTPPLHEFGVCVPVTFSHMDPYRIIDWVEANKLLGVTEINIYHVQLSNETLHVLRFYEREGTVRLFDLPSVPFYEKSRNGNKIGSPISLNDCMYRNTYRYKWIVVIDFDELIVPRSQNNYRAMIDQINKEMKLSHSPPSYTFRNMYFWVGCGMQKEEPQNSFILRYLLREPANKFLYAAKSILDPRRCISVFNHYCYIRFPLRDKNEKWTIDVKTSIAASHHYRNLYSGKKGAKEEKKCQDLKKNGEIDESALRIKEGLSRRLRYQIEAIYS